MARTAAHRKYGTLLVSMMSSFVGMLMLSGFAALPLKPAPEKLQPWTTHLRDQQPDQAFAAVYRVGWHRLVFVAAQHENQRDSSTFRTIEGAYAAFKFDTVIAEGFPTSWGPNPARILDDVAKSKPSGGFVEGGETVPTVVGAQQQGAVLFGGEANDRDVKAQIVAADFPVQDLLGFYVLRNIPQWIGEHAIDSAADARLKPLVVAALARNRAHLELASATLPGFDDWAAWYEKMNRQTIGASFVTEEVGPLADGPFGTNKIAYAVWQARDVYLHRLIIDRLNRGENVLVVFGGSHFMIHRPALDAVLGRPCYVGTELARAIIPCRSWVDNYSVSPRLQH